MTVICPRCNAQSSDDALYCTVCGMTLGGALREAAGRDDDVAPAPGTEAEAADERNPARDPGSDDDPDTTSPTEPSWEPEPPWTTIQAFTPRMAREPDSDAGRTGDDDDFVPLQVPERPHGGVRGVIDRGPGKGWLVLLALLLLALGAAAAWGSGMLDGVFDDDPDQTPTVSSIALAVPATGTPDAPAPDVTASDPTPTSDGTFSMPARQDVGSPTTVAASPTTGDAAPQRIATPAATSTSTRASPSPSPSEIAAPPTPTADAATPTPEVTQAASAASPPALEPSPVARATELAARAGDAVSGASTIVASSAPVETPAADVTPTEVPSIETPVPAGDGTGGAPVLPGPTQPPGN